MARFFLDFKLPRQDKKTIVSVMNFLDRFFEISKRNSTVKTEITAGFTTFAAMSYILAVNPAILSSTGMETAGLITVTAIATIISSIAMGLYSNLPIAAAPAMGTNTYFAVIICAGMGLTWQQALSVTFYNGIVFLLISICGVREKIIKSLPNALKISLQCGIGLFIAFMGLQHSGIISKNDTTFVALGNLDTPQVWLTLLGFAAMAFMIAKKVRGAIIYSILAITAIAFFVPDADGLPLAKMPEKIVSLPNSISQTFCALDFAYPFRDIRTSLPVIFTLLLLDLFDTIGTVVALCKRMESENHGGEPKSLSKALVVDSSSTIMGALLGTSTVTCFVESASGIEDGGRTGLVSIITGICFAIALFFTPIISSIPAFVTAPALILVGIMMMSGIGSLNTKDPAEHMPAIFCMMMIMLSFSITKGFAFGVIMYVLMMAASSRIKKISAPTWGLFAVMCLFLFVI